MKAVRLGELRELLESAAFSAWWTDWQHATTARNDARVRHEDLVAQSELMALRSELVQRAAVEAFSRSGDVEDEGTRWSAQAQIEENHALALVGEFEQQRLRASEAWMRVGGAEKALEERREAVGGDRTRMKEALESALREAEKHRQSLAAEYEAADRKRRQLWDDAEAAWATSFERSLVGAEHDVLARRIRREAEKLFAEAEERRLRARQLSGDAATALRELRDAEGRLAALRTAAREKFECVPGVSFLYWRHRDDKRSAFAVSLSDQPEGPGTPAKALGLYVVGRLRGVAVLEIARDDAGSSAEERDRRLDQFLARREDGPPTT
jgi:hypothetical protein